MNNHFTGLQPILHVHDVPAEVEFYQKLGFSVITQDPDFAALQYGDRILFGLQPIPEEADLSLTGLVWQIGVADIDQIIQVCLKNKIDLYTLPAEQSWGEWLMSVRSPNGILVYFEGLRSKPDPNPPTSV